MSAEKVSSTAENAENTNKKDLEVIYVENLYLPFF